MELPRIDLWTVFVVLGYSIASIGIMFANKLILTAYHFPSSLFLACAQMFVTAVVFIVLVFCGRINIPGLSKDIVYKLLPFSCIYAIDVTMGLAGTGAISLPLFSALRRISNFFILYGEIYFFGKKHSSMTFASLFVMVTGAFIAVSGDIKFDLMGYIFIFINNFSTAGKGLLTKSRLSNYNFSSSTLLFYNSIFMLPFLSVLFIFSGKLDAVFSFPLWWDPMFIIEFLFSCLAAVTLQFLVFECTRLTSALTTSIIGVSKNIIVTYGGMLVGGDYIFTVLNFSGVTISTFGAVMYVISMYRTNVQKVTPSLPLTKNAPNKEII